MDDAAAPVRSFRRSPIERTLLRAFALGQLGDRIRVREEDIYDGGILARLGADETVTGLWTFNQDLRTLQNLRSRSGTSFWGTFDHANTADRAYTMQDADGTVAFLGDVADQSFLSRALAGDAPDARKTDKSAAADESFLRRALEGPAPDATRATVAELRDFAFKVAAL